MALEHAILVALSEQESSGYDLARRFDRSIGYFWTATHQQVYRVLARMEADGWVLAEDVAQDGRPDKRMFRTSDSGRAELARWLETSVEPPAVRSELAVMVRGAASGDPRAVAAEVRRHRELHSERLEVYRRIAKRDFGDPDSLTGSSLHQYLVLRGGLIAEQAYLEWLDETLAGLTADRSDR